MIKLKSEMWLNDAILLYFFKLYLILEKEIEQLYICLDRSCLYMCHTNHNN